MATNAVSVAVAIAIVAMRSSIIRGHRITPHLLCLSRRHIAVAPAGLLALVPTRRTLVVAECPPVAVPAPVAIPCISIAVTVGAPRLVRHIAAGMTAALRPRASRHHHGAKSESRQRAEHSLAHGFLRSSVNGAAG